MDFPVFRITSRFYKVPSGQHSSTCFSSVLQQRTTSCNLSDSSIKAFAPAVPFAWNSTSSLIFCVIGCVRGTGQLLIFTQRFSYSFPKFLSWDSISMITIIMILFFPQYISSHISLCLNLSSMRKGSCLYFQCCIPSV